jgi:phosphoribosylamine---glycine ligase
MNILLLGSGGREHTLAWKMSQSPLCKNLFIAPGNAGTKAVGENVDLQATDFDGVADFCKSNLIDLLVVGPEEPLVKGIREFLEAIPSLSTLKIIGPGKEGATLEGSKDFSKAFMQRHGVPTASSQTFEASQIDEALAYLQNHSLPIVLKADGLAAGKGVVISETHEDAIATIKSMLLDKQFGEASAKVVVEQFLKGIELSVFVLTDGKDYVILPEAKDYKRIGEGDTGLNTGGMGSISPVPFADAAFMRKVDEKVIKPTIAGLQKDNIPYKGFIFIGLMNMNGKPWVIEYNVRMGDPETQSVVARIDNDLVDLLLACAEGRLANYQMNVSEKTAATVVLVSEGYPGSYPKGRKISGLDEAHKALIFHAGTMASDTDVLTSGGRVLGITGLGNDINEALEIAYDSINRINYQGMNYRKDIGKDLLKA